MLMLWGEYNNMHPLNLSRRQVKGCKSKGFTFLQFPFLIALVHRKRTLYQLWKIELTRRGGRRTGENPHFRFTFSFMGTDFAHLSWTLTLGNRPHWLPLCISEEVFICACFFRLVATISVWSQGNSTVLLRALARGKMRLRKINENANFFFFELLWGLHFHWVRKRLVSCSQSALRL